MINPIPETIKADSRWSIINSKISTGVGRTMPCLQIRVVGIGVFINMFVPVPPSGLDWEDIGFRLSHD